MKAISAHVMEATFSRVQKSAARVAAVSEESPRGEAFAALKAHHEALEAWGRVESVLVSFNPWAESSS